MCVFFLTAAAATATTFHVYHRIISARTERKRAIDREGKNFSGGEVNAERFNFLKGTLALRYRLAFNVLARLSRQCTIVIKGHVNLVDVLVRRERGRARKRDCHFEGKCRITYTIESPGDRMKTSSKSKSCALWYCWKCCLFPDSRQSLCMVQVRLHANVDEMCNDRHSFFGFSLFLSRFCWLFVVTRFFHFFNLHIALVVHD